MVYSWQEIAQKWISKRRMAPSSRSVLPTKLQSVMTIGRNLQETNTKSKYLFIDDLPNWLTLWYYSRIAVDFASWVNHNWIFRTTATSEWNRRSNPSTYVIVVRLFIVYIFEANANLTGIVIVIEETVEWRNLCDLGLYVSPIDPI